eukprot:TRINITY_DN12478_c3_g2_i1.p1 TRINITY_DN12478_c3_g2~~TRINITY_DN12478_c3_g2_i1.p1  ORF type:complete len:396 (+),score=56.49 TRINITY_DN12478_c3_g2_i1:35-1222(+)
MSNLERTASYGAAINNENEVAIDMPESQEKSQESALHRLSKPLGRHDVLGKTIACNEAVTLSVKRQVTPGREAEYEKFIQELAIDAQRFPGFMGITILRPEENGSKHYWNIFIKFDSHKHSDEWFQSKSRLERLLELEASGVTSDNANDLQVDLQRGWVTRYVADSSLQLVSKDEFQPVTVVITRRIRPGAEDAYRDWCVRITDEARRYPGHLGTSLILPSPKDDRWIVLYRFDSFDHIEAWHASSERAALIDELKRNNIVLDGDQEDVQTQTGWASFFTPGEKQVSGAPGGPPPKYRTAVVVFIAVWIAVSLLSFENSDKSVRSLNPTLRDALELPAHPERIPLSVFISNFAAIPIIFFILVPIIAHFLKPWLRMPGPSPPKNKYLKKLFRVVV